MKSKYKSSNRNMGSHITNWILHPKRAVGATSNIVEKCALKKMYKSDKSAAMLMVYENKFRKLFWQTIIIFYHT